MKSAISGFTIGVLALLTACVGSNTIVKQAYSFHEGDSFSYRINNKAEVPTEELATFENRLKQQLGERGLTSDKPNRTLEIVITKFRFRSETARVLAGTSAGTDAVISTIVVKSAADSSVLGELEVASQNPTIASTSTDLMNSHADKIVKSLAR